MDLQQVWKMQGILILLVLTGYILKRIDMIKSEDKAVLTNLVINLFLPTTILNSFQMEFKPEMINRFGSLIGLAAIAIILSYLLGIVLYSNYSQEKRNVLRFGTLISNAGFIGMPVAESFYGPLGLMYSAVFVIPFRIALWTVGLSLFSKEEDSMSTLKSMARQPCMVAVYMGIVMMVTGLRFFEPVNTTVVMMSRYTTPIIMILIGAIIGEVHDIRTIFNWDALRFSLIRLLFIPTIIYFIASLSTADPVVAGTAVVLTSMPAGNATVLLAAKYDGDYVLGTKIVILSTLLSMITIPFWGIML